jgi:hypothetical protein
MSSFVNLSEQRRLPSDLSQVRKVIANFAFLAVNLPQCLLIAHNSADFSLLRMSTAAYND